MTTERRVAAIILLAVPPSVALLLSAPLCFIVFAGTSLVAFVGTRAIAEDVSFPWVAQVILSVFLLYDAFFGMATFRHPLLSGLAMGAVWGYALAAYRHSRIPPSAPRVEGRTLSQRERFP